MYCVRHTYLIELEAALHDINKTAIPSRPLPLVQPNHKPASNVTIMAPPWVLLDRHVKFVDAGVFAGGAGKAAAAIGGSIREPSVEEDVAAMEPHPAVADPPEATRLSMLRGIPAHPMQSVHDGTISSTDRGLVVLYTGRYRPGNGGYLRTGY